MHLGEEGSRKRMRATMRIMRLMLSLSFLFHSAFPSVPSANLTTIQALSNGSTSPISIQGSAAVTDLNATADPHASSQTQPQISITNNTSSSSNVSTSGSHPPVSSPTATLSPLKTTIPAATANNSAPVVAPATANKSASVVAPATPDNSAPVVAPSAANNSAPVVAPATANNSATADNSAPVVAPATADKSASVATPATANNSAPVVAPATANTSASVVAPATADKSASVATPATANKSASVVAPATADKSASVATPATANNSAPVVAPSAANNSAPVVAPATANNSATADNSAPVVAPATADKSASVATPATANNSAPVVAPATANKSASVGTPATAGSGSTPGGFLNITKVQTTATLIPSTNSTTESLVPPKTTPNPAETPKIPKVSHPTLEQTHSAITKMSERDTEKTTLPVSRNGQIKPGTTITHPTLIVTGSHVHGSQSGTTFLQTSTAITTDPQPSIYTYSLNSRPENDKDKELAELCKRLMANLQTGNCTLVWSHKNGKVQFDVGEINGKVKTSLITQHYEEISKKPPDNKTLIAILASCGALLIMIFILAICASHHRRSFNENQQHLTEELHTVENGYHDNPTLEVMEVQPEMQEKKLVLNGEFSNDSWIVPIDNLLKEDILDEEDTHL